MINRILLFASLIILCVLSMLNGEMVELRIVKYFISDWVIAQLVYRIITLVILYSAFLILVGGASKLLKITTILSVGIILLDSLLNLAGYTDYYHIFLNYRYLAVSYSALAVAVISLFFFIKTRPSKKVKKWVLGVLILPVIGLSFIRVIYIEDWVTVAENEKQITLEEANKLLTDNDIPAVQDSLLLPFFTTSCPYCRAAAVKMSLSKQNGKLPNTVVVFPGDEERAQLFLKMTNLTGVDYITLEQKQFIELAGLRWPSVFFISKKESTQWIGGSFNNFCLNAIEKN